MATLPSGTVTLLFTDIEGSTRLWESQPDQMQAALVRHDMLVRSAVEAAGGYVFKTVGDAFCVAFPTAASALAGALDAQDALARERWPEHATIRARMALHSGLCSERDGDYFGPTVNRVARLEAIGHGGQVLLSGATVALLGDDLPDGVQLRDLGEHRLKDLAAGERVFQAVVSGLTDSFPALRSLGNAEFHHNLPRYATSFVGRAVELRDVQALVGAGRLLTLVGVGGTGKTRLAVQVAAELLDGQGDGVWLVELASVTEPAQVAPRIASVLGIGAVAGRAVDDTLVDALASRRLLLVLDNCEHVIDAVAGFADAVLSRCPHVALLATSREPLDVDGEQLYRLAPLRSPAAGGDFATIDASEAVRLFVERAQAHRREFDLTTENAAAVAEICRHLDGLPLAIELAAATVRTFTVSEIASNLDARFVLLAGGGHRGSAERHQTLRSVIDWSYNLLDDPQRRAFARLSVFTGGWTLDAATAVCATEAGGEASTIALTRALVDKSLVETIQTDDTTRYDMLETIRAYAIETLATAGDGAVDAARAAHFRHFAALAEQAAPHLTQPDQVVWFDRLDADAANLQAAVAYGVRHDPDAALRLVVALVNYWRHRSHPATVIADLRTLVADTPSATTLQADGLWLLGRLERMVGNLDAARECIERTISIVQPLGDQSRLAHALIEKGLIGLVKGDYDEATVCSNAALECARAVSDDALLADCEAAAGVLQSLSGDAATCMEHLERALAYFERVGDEGLYATALLNIAALEVDRPDPDLERVTIRARRALEIFEERKERAAANALWVLALTLAREGRVGEARALFPEVVSRAHRQGSVTDVPLILVDFAHVTLGEAPARTAELLGHADALSRRLGLVPPQYGFASLDATVRRCRDALGEEVYRTHYEHGARLPTSDVVDALLADHASKRATEFDRHR